MLRVALVLLAAEAALAQGRAAVAVLPPRAAPLFASVDDGIRWWVADRLAAANLPLVERDTVSAAVASLGTGEARPLRGTDAPVLAERTGAAALVFTEIRYGTGEVDLRMRAHDPTREILVATRQQGRVSELGDLLQAATAVVLEGLGSVPGPAQGVPAPALSELGQYERALAAVDGGHLVAAWRELEGTTTPAADALRQEILIASRAAEVSPAERSRLASLRGAKDRDWLRVRQALLEGDDATMTLAAADAALARGDADQALSLYDDAIAIEPALVDAWAGRARMLEQAGRHEPAAEAFRTVLEAMPEEPAAHEALARNPAVAPAEQAQHWMQAGRLRAGRLEVDSARGAWTAAGKQDRSVATAATRNLGALHERIGRFDEALLTYEEAAAAGDDADALAGLGRMRLLSGDDAGAHEAFDAALEIRPDHTGALLAKGRALLAADRADAALPLLDRAVATAPEDGGARRALAQAHQQTGNATAALDLLDPAAFAPSQRAEVLAEVASVHAAAGRLPEARAALEKAISLEPEDPPLRESLADVLAEEGDAPAAQAQRIAAAGLVGVRIEPTDRSEASLMATPAATTAGAIALAPLAESFPSRSPETGRPLGPVLFVGVSEPLDWKGHLREWLLPWSTDVEAVDTRLIEALIQRFDLVAPPEIPRDVVSPLARLREFSTDRGDIALVNDALGVDALFVAQVARSSEALARSAPLQVELRLLGGQHGDEVFILANQQLVSDGSALRAWNVKAALPWSVLLVLFALPVVRGWGTLVVHLEYERRKDSEGFFSIELSRTPGKVKRKQASEDSGKRAKKQRYQHRAKAWKRFSRSMVDRETRFRFVPARTWYVVVHGLLQDKNTKEVIGSFLEEMQVVVDKGEVTTIPFDLRPKEAVLEVRLLRGENASDVQATVALRGRADTVRYVKDETTVYTVGNGEHVVVVGVEDRVYEQQVLVTELNGAVLSFALEGPDPVFEGCPEAVGPYLNGDLETASRALDRAGLTDVANWIRAEFHKERGESGEAARFYQAAGHLTMAAELSSGTDDAGQSATLFEQAGDFGKAAEAYARAGDARKAAQAYEAAYDYEAAIEAYRQAGDTAKTMELLEKTGGYYEAASLSLEEGDVERGIRNLQLVDLRDPDYGEACRALAEIFAEREEWSLALEKARESVSVAGDEAAPLELQEKLGNLLERAGRLEQALEVFEGIRKRDYQYPGAKERVADLRGRIDSAATVAAGVTTDGAATAIAGAPRAAPRDARYEILEELGRGGMGIVYKARDTRLGRVVALKQLPENLREHPTAVQLFLREARSAAALNHQNIVTLFDADQTEGGDYYITMECLEGFPIDKILRKRGKLSTKDTLRLAVQISTGLQYAHERRIVHRDIKTSNLFFTREKVVKIMDFGLAKMMEEVRRAATVIGGTPYYMAPEQAAGEDLDHRADLYAFGVTLFELLAGRVPYTDGDVTYQHRHSPVPDVREHAPEVPEELATLVRQLMAKSPDERPATTAEVTATLESMLQRL